jgi:hypothetical protein
LRKIGQEVYESSDKRNLLHRLYAYLSGIIFINCASGTHFHSSISKTNTLNDLMVSQSSFIEQFESHYPTFFPKYSLSKSKPTKENPNGYVIFHFKGENGNLGDRLFYPMPLVSSGIIAQTKVIANIAQADSDSLIVVDEIDNSLHTLVLKAFIEEIVNRKLQMIFVSHDTNLLSSFRPDQIYFANWKNGISSLKRLSIIYPGIREINNIEKMYLDGVFDKKIDE